MKNFQRLCIALTAAAFLASAGSASATILTSPSGTEYTSGFKATAAESILIKAGFASFTCTESSTSGSLTSNGFSGGAAIINTTLSFGGCGTGKVAVLTSPSLYFRATASEAANFEAPFLEVTLSSGGTSCVYGTPGVTTVGTVKGGSPATMTLSGGLVKISGGFLCASPASWSGKYTVTEPKPLLIDNN